MNLEIYIDKEFYTINQLVEEFKEAVNDRRLMSYELENNENTIQNLKFENSRLANVSQNLELEKLEAESQLAYAQDRILELEEALSQIQNLANKVL